MRVKSCTRATSQPRRKRADMEATPGLRPRQFRLQASVRQRLVSFIAPVGAEAGPALLQGAHGFLK